MAGTLYLCATPIGNLKDMTPRVIETLQEADIIAAEDTRNSIKLLNHFAIKTSMTSYHEYNKVEKADYLVEQLMQGKNVALVTDAGTPAISDPGEVLVQKCMQAGIVVTSLPGACACITALTLSGLGTKSVWKSPSTSASSSPAARPPAATTWSAVSSTASRASTRRAVSTASS